MPFNILLSEDQRVEEGYKTAHSFLLSFKGREEEPLGTTNVPDNLQPAESTPAMLWGRTCREWEWSGDQQRINGMATTRHVWGILWTSYVTPIVQGLLSAWWCLNDIDKRKKNLR